MFTVWSDEGRTTVALRDELSRLDADVAAGQISAAEFRARRDQLLAAAGSGPAAAGPFPPSYRWGDPVEQSGEERTQAIPRTAPEDRTQVVPRKTAASADRTQVVRRAAQQAPAAPRPADPERTQVVRPGPQPTSGYANVGAPPWARGVSVAGRSCEPGFQRPEGTLPPWTLGEPTCTAQRPVNYANGADFGHAGHRRWVWPLVALVVVGVLIGLVVLFLV